MRKRLIAMTSQDATHSGEGWLDLDSAATVEVTSEEKDYPVEFALVSGEVRGWRDSERAERIALGLGSLGDSLPQGELLSRYTNPLGVAARRLQHFVNRTLIGGTHARNATQIRDQVRR